MKFLYYSLFFITPLLVVPITSELFEFNKLIFIYLIGLLATFFGLLRGTIDGKIIFRRSILDLSILLFLTSQILSTIFSIDRQTSLFGYYGRFNGGLFSIITYFALFYVFISFFEKKHLEKLLNLSLFTSFIVVLWGLPGKFGYDMSCLLFLGRLNNNCWSDQFRPAERMFSTLGQPNWLGAYLAINFFIGLYFYFTRKNQEKMNLPGSLWPYWVYLMLNFAGILFTRSRSAYIALSLGIIIFMTVIAKNKESFKSVLKKLKFMGLGFLVLVFVFKTGINSIDQYLSINPNNQAPSSKQVQNSKSQTNVTESGDIRKIVWKGAWDLGLKYPIFGTGVETFAYSYYFVRPKEHNMTSEWDFLYNKAHNEYLNYLATTGFMGLATYLFFIASCIYLFYDAFKRDENKLLILSIATGWSTILVTNFFGFSTTVINLFFYLLPAIIAVYIERSREITLLNIKKKKIAAALFTLPALYIILFLVNYYRGDVLYAKAESYLNAGDYQNAAINYDKASRLHYEHVYLDKLSSSYVNLAYLTASSADKAFTDSLFKAADMSNKASLASTSKNVLYWKTKAKNHYFHYQLTGEKKDLQTAISAIETAERLSPTDPKIFYTTALFYSTLEEVEEKSENKEIARELALIKTSRSVELKRDFRDGYFLRAQLFIKYGREEDAKRDLEFILKNISSNDKEARDILEKLK